MGYARSGRDRRDLSKHETVYEDPDYEKLRAGQTRRQKVTRNVLAGGTSLETLGGLVAIVVCLVGFSQMPFQMAAVGAIAIGLALFAQGAAVAARWRDTVRRIEGMKLPPQELAGGVSTEVFGGLTGVVLGILALLGVKPLVLLPAAAIVFGGALLLGGAAQPDLVYLAPERNPRVARQTYSAIQTSGGVMVLVGVASAVLGILGVLKVGPVLTLSLVAYLAIGAALVFAGGALTARLLRRFA
ncbi:MAG: hypothetical protein HOV81_35420 [Kofleriaceae bacterium]|nr:hypothetical protein [Kofleriaceae bacterium]